MNTQVNESKTFHHVAAHFPPVASLTFPERVWTAALQTGPHGDLVTEELQIRDAHTGDWIAFERLPRIGVGEVVQAFEDAARRHNLPDVVVTKGRAFQTDVFARWADRHGILIEEDSGVSSGSGSREPALVPQLHAPSPAVAKKRPLRPSMTGLLAGPPLPDLGRKVAQRRPPEGFFMMGFTLRAVTIHDSERCSSTCIHEWGGDPHNVHLEFPLPILRRLLGAFDEGPRWKLVESLQSLPFPIEAHFPSPISVPVLQCTIKDEHIRSGSGVVPFTVLQAVVAPARRQRGARQAVH